ncbi:MAG TPA: rhomboid family intramembrane serine protease [Candidatus Binatia bacterium]|nr:rhomboid family intramembrane serine protease [Candidatus Binatia bacterium]
MTEGSRIPLRVTRDRNLAEEWELALVAQGFSPSLSSTRDGFVLCVPEKEMKRALVGLSAYERENPPNLREGDEPLEPPNLVAGGSIAGILLIFFFITTIGPFTAKWFDRGSADTDQILLGELWRTVTALSLHANLAHALSNAIGITIFVAALSSILGPGLASALILLAGAGGNLINAFIHGSAHVSIGASTAVFGAVGMLGGLGLAARGRGKVPKRRAWLPVAAALALLAMLGAGGEQVDVLAHLFGFLFGGILGFLFAFVTPRPPGFRIQWACGSAALALLISCWLVALR